MVESSRYLANVPGIADGLADVVNAARSNRSTARAPLAYPVLSTRDYHDKVKAAGGYDALVKQHRRILASVVDKVVEAKFGRRAPQEVCAHAALFIAPPGGS